MVATAIYTIIIFVIILLGLFMTQFAEFLAVMFNVLHVCI